MADIRILIAEDHRLFREGLRHLLHEQPGFCVVDEAVNGREVLRLVKKVQADILLLDLEILNVPGMEVLRSLSSYTEKPSTIVLASTIEKDQASEAYRLGARGVILKEAATTLLFKCINAVVAGQYWVLREATSDLSKIEGDPRYFGRKGRRSSNYDLTKREMEILSSVVAGKSNREIARQFSISEQTVKHHMTNIFDKVGVYNRLELALFAIHHGLIGKTRVQ